MAGHPKEKSNTGLATTRKAEKLSALAALLGSDAMERLRAKDTGFSVPDGAEVSANADRVAWQRNRLLARFRAGDISRSTNAQETGQPAPYHATQSNEDPSSRVSVDSRISATLDLETLAQEHPAVITRVLRKVDREERVALLRAMPGPVARATIRRLRDT